MGLTDKEEELLDIIQEQFHMSRNDAEVVLKTAQLTDTMDSLRVHLGLPLGDADV